LDWLEVLGYDADPEFIRLSQQQIDSPLLELDLASAHGFTVNAPHSAQELFDNAQKLLSEF